MPGSPNTIHIFTRKHEAAASLLHNLHVRQSSDLSLSTKKRPKCG